MWTISLFISLSRGQIIPKDMLDKDLIENFIENAAKFERILIDSDISSSRDFCMKRSSVLRKGLVYLKNISRSRREINPV